MDRTWLDAPWPALRVQRLAAHFAVQMNGATRAWAAQRGVSPPQLERWAVAQAGGDASEPLRLRCVSVPLPDGCLLWLQPDEPEEADARIEQARRATEFLDRALVLAGVSVWRIDLQARRIYFNVVGFNVVGMAQDPRGIDLDAMRASVHPDDLPAVLRGADEAMASQRVVDVIARYRNTDGSWRTLLTRRVAQRDAHGVAVGLAGISMDLSGEMAERERAESMAERARLAAEALGVGFWSREEDTGAGHWDDRMYRIYGLDPAAGPPPREQWLRDCVHPQDHARLAHQAQQPEVLQGPPGPLIEATFRLSDGAHGERWVQSWTRRVLRQGRRMSYGMHMDVSARQRAEQIVQHERARAQMAIEAIGVGIWERNAAGEVIHWNEAMYRLRGLSPDDPRTPEAITAATLHVEDQARFEALLRRLPQADTPVRDEFRVSLPDGSWRWLASEGRALRDAGGGLVGMAGVNFDVTERRHAELLRLETQRLEQAGRERAAFLARVSHDLRTPMNAVLGFTQLMQDDPQDAPSPTQQARLAHIGRAAQAMMVLIDDLLQITHGSTAPVSAARSAALDVLCIEDNPVNLQLVRELLALRPAVRLRTAESGMEGIATAVAGPPQLVLLDLHLPDLSGMEVMQRLRGIAAMEGCHIVALSADAMPESIRTALEAGFDDYWTKPIQFDHFLAGIDHLAAVHAAAVGPAALKAPGAP